MGLIKPPHYYIGLMSGTSMDGVDGVLTSFNDHGMPEVLGHVYLPMPHQLKAELIALNAPTDNELHRSAIAANQLIETLYAPAVYQLIQDAGINTFQVIAIGAHGQTVRHQPQITTPDQNTPHTGYSIQLNAPALLAELTQIPVVCDFRSRDIAAGGQGAPLVPAFHQQIFSQPNQTVGILNLGGIANLTVLKPDSPVIGFDCGPANALLDYWCEKHTHAPFDANGAWAAQGQTIPDLLQHMLNEPYFALAAPKSTGRDLFNPAWLAKQLEAALGSYTGANKGTDTIAVNIQATLLDLTVISCANAFHQYAPNATQLIVCGGGAFNTQLINKLQIAIASTSMTAPAQLHLSSAYGLPPLQVEATAFAWLAKQCLEKQCANLPAVTGAKGLRVLGAVYPA